MNTLGTHLPGADLAMYSACRASSISSAGLQLPHCTLGSCQSRAGQHGRMDAPQMRAASHCGRLAERTAPLGPLSGTVCKRQARPASPQQIFSGIAAAALNDSTDLAMAMAFTAWLMLAGPMHLKPCQQQICPRAALLPTTYASLAPAGARSGLHNAHGGWRVPSIP